MPNCPTFLKATACLFLLPHLALAAAVSPGPDVLELPALAVSDRPGGGADHPSLVAVGTGLADDAGLAELARETAGFAVNDAGAHGFGTTVTLRGLANTPYFSDASAPVYLDDIPLGSAFTFPTGLYDFTRLVVYRGPQAAARFGRAGDAGVIQLVSAEPGEQTTGAGQVSVGDFGLRSAAVSMLTSRQGPVDVAASAAASGRDGYVRNTTLGIGVDDRRSVSGHFKLRYRPTADLELSLQFLAQRSRDGAQPLVPLGGPFHEVARGKEGRMDTDFVAAAVGITKRLAGATLSATTSLTDWNLSPYSNRLVVFGGANFDSAVTQSQRTFNEEVRYIGDWLTAGAFFSHGDTKGGATRAFSGFTIEDSSFATKANTLALFGRASLVPGNGWILMPGLRLERTGKDFVRTEVVPGTSLIRRNNAWTAVLPSLTATRHLGAATDLTFTVARGFKPGGYSAYTGRADLAEFAPQRTWGAEAALTTTGRSPDWSFTARAYASRVRGYQIERSFAVPASATDEYLVVNADRVRVLGVEVESQWRPSADLMLTAVAALTQISLEEFTDPFTRISYAGRRAPFAPSGNAAVRADYRLVRQFRLGAGVTWTGRTFYDEQETALFAQPGYFLLDAHAAYRLAAGEIRIFGRNLGGVNYYSAITPGVAHGTPGAPRTWGVAFDRQW